MILLENQATLTDLHALIDRVQSYPVSVGRVLDLAGRIRSPKAVIDFYRTFPKEEIFSDKDDLLTTTDNVDMLRHQSAPIEEMLATED